MKSIFKKYCKLFSIYFFLPVNLFAQSDTSVKNTYSTIFSKITAAVKNYKLDTAAAPNDRITKKIIELRKLKGGFNINEAVEFKLEEDKEKNEISKEEFEKISVFFKNGNGKRWLDNAIISIYRQHFTYKELKQLVKFHKTPAGKKMSDTFPVIMLESFAAAQMIKNSYPTTEKK